MNDSAETIDEYIGEFPKEVQKILEQIRESVRKAAPQSVEAIKYGIPTFVSGGNLVHFGAFKNHIGFYPAPTGIKKFEKELSVFKQGKGSVQFPINEPMPLELIKKIVEFRISQNAGKASKKKK